MDALSFCYSAAKWNTMLNFLTHFDTVNGKILVKFIVLMCTADCVLLMTDISLTAYNQVNISDSSSVNIDKHVI